MITPPGTMRDTPSVGYTRAAMDEQLLRRLFQNLRPHLPDAEYRLVAAATAQALGRGHGAKVARAAQINHWLVNRARRMLAEGKPFSEWPIKPDVTPHALSDRHSKQRQILQRLISFDTGEKHLPLLWTCRGCIELAHVLGDAGFPMSMHSVWRLLQEMGYSLQPYRRRAEVFPHRSAEAQLRYVNRRAGRFLNEGWPVLSLRVRVVQRRAQTEDRPMGKEEGEGGASPPRGRAAWEDVRLEADIVPFVSDVLRSTWQHRMGPAANDAPPLLLCLDAGQWNHGRSADWLRCVQGLAKETGATVTVCHIPSATYKWKAIAHRSETTVTLGEGTDRCRRETITVEVVSSEGFHLAATEDLPPVPWDPGEKDAFAHREEVVGGICLRRHEFNDERNYDVLP